MCSNDLPVVVHKAVVMLVARNEVVLVSMQHFVLAILLFQDPIFQAKDLN